MTDPKALCERLSGAAKGLNSEDLTGYIPRGVSIQDCLDTVQALRDLASQVETLQNECNHWHSLANERAFKNSYLTAENARLAREALAIDGQAQELSAEVARLKASEARLAEALDKIRDRLCIHSSGEAFDCHAIAVAALASRETKDEAI